MNRTIVRQDGGDRAGRWTPRFESVRRLRRSLAWTGPLLLAAAWCGAAEPERWFGFNTYAPNAETLRKFAEAGVNTVVCFPANVLSSTGAPYNSAYPPIWLGPGQYDFECLDKQIADKLAVNPKAKFIFFIDLNTPAWWCRVRGVGDSFSQLGRVAASDMWRRDTREYLHAVLQHLESRHREVIIAYFLACGMTIEWQDFQRGEEGAVRRAAWRQWMIGRGHPDPVDIPPASVRDHVSHGPFRDPAADALAVHYWKFSHELIGSTILYYAAAAQEVIKHRAPLGLCYGYILEHGRNRLLYEGHLDFDRVYASPDLDWFISPGSYHDRQVGGASGFMVPISSIQHHRKGFLMSMDHRTPSARSVSLLGRAVPGHESGFRNEADCIAGLRREFSLRLISGISTYWFDLFGHWFEGQAIFDSIAQMRTLWDRLAQPREESAAQVAVLVDAESMYYLDGRADFYNDLLFKQRYGLYRMGAPFDVFSFADLPTLDLSRYKLVLLPNLFVVDAQRRELLRKQVCTEGRTVVWVYAPGIIADGKYDPSQVEALTGIPWETPELTSRPRDGWRSVFSPQPNLSAAVLRRLAREAGVHIYSEAEEPLYANRRLIALHTIAGGPRTVVLPRRCRRVTEVFSERVVAENTDRFEDHLTAPCTVLYQLEE
ncbi:MAG: hypothetical protein GX575_03225 [Candidatus Anammoximicrobium sp.]|nr:hypothetical protein [Candidatus Anammoximicrobium sp.]